MIIEGDELELREAKRLYSLENFDRILIQMKTMETQIEFLTQ
jgi:hypothetical protein